jgi:hypothetical protein
MTYEQACTLKPAVASALFEAVLSVSGKGDAGKV